MAPRLSLGPEISRQAATCVCTAGLHGPPAEVGTARWAEDTAMWCGYFRARPIKPSAVLRPQAPASPPALVVSQCPPAAAAHAAAAGPFPFPPPPTCRGDSSAPRPF